MKNDQLAELQHRNLDICMKLAQLSLDNSQRLMAMQVEIAKKLFEDGVENAKQQTSNKDPQKALSLQNQYAQEAGQTLMEASRQMAELYNASCAECAQLFTEQYASGNKDLLSSCQALFSQFPGSSNNLFESMNQAMNSLNSAFEQFAKASTTTFAQEAKPNGKRRQA